MSFEALVTEVVRNAVQEAVRSEVRSALADAMSTIRPVSPPGTALLRIDEVLQRVKMGRTKWFKGIREGKYPRGISQGNYLVWPEAAIADVVERIARGELS